MKGTKVLKWLKDNVFYIVVGVILFAYAFSMIYALVWAFFVTVKPSSWFIDTPMDIFKGEMTMSHWVDVLSKLRVKVDGQSQYIEQLLLNSIVYAGGCALVSTLCQCIAAYLTAKYDFQFSKIVYTVVIIAMIIPIVGALPSEMQVLRSMGLYDNLLGIYILKMNFLGMYFLVFYAIFKSLPWSYAESAFIDGASHFKVMTRIMLPLVQTTFLAVFLLNFIIFWNDYQGPMLYLPSFPTASYGIFYAKFNSTDGLTNEQSQLASCVLAAVPVIILFLLFQKRLMGNLTVGGIKG